MESIYENGGFIGRTFDFADLGRYSIREALSVNYITLVQENAPGATSHTFSGVSTTGLTSSDTLIVIFHSEVTAHTAGNPVTSVTINGSSATIDYQTPTTTITANIGITAVARISSITASTVNITVNYPSQSILRAAVSTYIVPGATSLTVLDTDEFGFVGSSSNRTLTTNVENGGLVIYGLSLGDENDTTVWSDATENYDVAASEINSQWAGAYYLPISTESHVESLTISGATNNGVGLAVSYESNIVPGNIKNSGIWNLKAVLSTLSVGPTLRSGFTTSINDTTSASTFNLDVPVHVPGDYLYVFLTVNTATFITSVPAGWTLLGSATATTERIGVYYKVASGSEPASYSWTAASGHAAISFSVGNVSEQTLGTIGVSGLTDTSVSVPAVTTYNKGLVFMLACIDNAGDFVSYTSSNYTFTQQGTLIGAANAGSCGFAASGTTIGDSSGTGTCTIDTANGLAAVFLAVGP